jgi:hypothetical protein
MEAGRMKVPAGLVELLRKRLADKKLGAHGRVAS